MKKSILIGFMLSLFVHLSAQEQFGSAIFEVPAGWQITKSDNQVVLEKPMQKGTVCKIIISTATKGAVLTQADYIKYRNSNGGAGVAYDNSRGAVTKYEANGLTTFLSGGSMTERMVTVRSYFYSLSNGTQTLFYQLYASNNDCIASFNTFQASLKMETDDSGSTNARRKKAAIGAPAAPAPVM